MKAYIFKLILVALFSLIFLRTLYSQDVDSKKITASSDENEEHNFLKKGKWALQFAIDENFTLINFDGATLSIKRHFSKRTALRFSFNGSYFKYENDTNNSMYSKQVAAGFNLIFIYYLNPNEEFNIYGYAGGQYSYRYNSSAGLYDFSNRTSSSAGPVLGAGAEYFVFRRLSLFAEYSYAFNFGKDKSLDQTTIPSFEQIESTYDIVSLNANAVKFGLSVYF